MLHTDAVNECQPLPNAYLPFIVPLRDQNKILKALLLIFHLLINSHWWRETQSVVEHFAHFIAFLGPIQHFSKVLFMTTDHLNSFHSIVNDYYWKYNFKTYTCTH